MTRLICQETLLCCVQYFAAYYASTNFHPQSESHVLKLGTHNIREHKITSQKAARVVNPEI